MLVSLISSSFCLGEKCISGKILFDKCFTLQRERAGMQLLVCILDKLVYIAAGTPSPLSVTLKNLVLKHAICVP